MAQKSTGDIFEVAITVFIAKIVIFFSLWEGIRPMAMLEVKIGRVCLQSMPANKATLLCTATVHRRTFFRSKYLVINDWEYPMSWQFKVTPKQCLWLKRRVLFILIILRYCEKK